MKRAIQLWSLVLGLLILVAPTSNMIVPWLTERPLAGAVAPLTRPIPSVASIRTETFQRSFTAWFEQHYGVRATATRLDNSLGFYLFRELRPEKPVRVGKNGVLFLDEQVASWNVRDDRHAGAEAFARLARLAQDALAARGKALVVLALPAKPTFYPGSLPERYLLPLGDATTRPFERLVYGPYVEALRRHGVDFVDGRAAAERLRGTPDAVYPYAGRHISGPVVCVILEDALALVRARLPDAAIPTLDCRFREVVPPTLDREEFDLLRLMNVWGVTPGPIPEMVTVEDRAPTSPRLDTLVVGSSFSWRILSEAERNHVLGKLHLFYYNTTVVEDGLKGAQYPVPPAGSERWRQLVLDKSLFILPIPPEYMPVNDADFLIQLVDALGVDPGDLREFFAPWAH